MVKRLYSKLTLLFGAFVIDPFDLRLCRRIVIFRKDTIHTVNRTVNIFGDLFDVTPFLLFLFERFFDAGFQKVFV